MNQTALCFAMLTAFAFQSIAISAGEWETKFNSKKPHAGAKKLSGVVHEGLDFTAYPTKLGGKPHLAVMIRNGHHKMGAASIGLQCPDTPATIKVGRIEILKPMSIISGKPDGTHLFETFTENGTPYQIF